MTGKSKASEIDAIQRNVAAIHRVRKNLDESRAWGQRVVDRLASYAGSPSSLVFHLIVYGAWLIYSLAHHSLEYVSAFASLEAIFLAVCVLINQRRMNAVERRNADLGLQVSLLTEHEITRLAQMLDLIAKKLDVKTDVVDDLEAIKKDVKPQQILKKISEHEQNDPTASTSDLPQKPKA